MAYADMQTFLDNSPDTVMRPLTGLPPCIVTPTATEETMCQHALSDPTAKNADQAWFHFSDLINIFPYLFNSGDTWTVA